MSLNNEEIARINNLYKELDKKDVIIKDLNHVNALLTAEVKQLKLLVDVDKVLAKLDKALKKNE